WKIADLGGRGRLLIAGDGPERERLEQQAERLAIDVAFVGHVERDRANALLGSARAFIAPSLFVECAPRAVVEAMSAGRPILASRVSGLDELARPEVGIQFAPGDAIAM